MSLGGYREQTCGYQGRGVRGGMEWKVGISRCKLLHIEWMILHRTGSYVQYTVTHHNGKYFLKECICN